MKYYIKKEILKNVKTADKYLTEIALKNITDNFYVSNLRHFKNINILWTKIQKNASSSIFKSLIYANGDILSADILSSPIKFQNMMSNNYKNIRSKDVFNCIKIICIRDPKKRIIDLFLDKIVNNYDIDENSARLLSKIKKPINKIQFVDFLNFLSINRKTLNKLWKNQSTYILFNNYTHVFNCDMLTNQWTKLKIGDINNFLLHSTDLNDKFYEKIDVDLSMSITDMKEILKHNSFNVNSFFNEEILNIFNDIYSDDIKLYDYLFGIS